MHGFNGKRDEKGFTLIEMLIVVAIIAILVAVSIPLVTSALDKARCATDAANERAAKAEMMIMYMTGEPLTFANSEGDSTFGLYVYDAVNGKLILNGKDGFDDVAVYGQSTLHEHTKKKIFVRIWEDGVIQLGWAEKVSGTGNLVGWSQDLCSSHVGSN